MLFLAVTLVILVILVILLSTVILAPLVILVILLSTVILAPLVVLILIYLQLPSISASQTNIRRRKKIQNSRCMPLVPRQPR
jgi:hypothetical protein